MLIKFHWSFLLHKGLFLEIQFLILTQTCRGIYGTNLNSSPRDQHVRKLQKLKLNQALAWAHKAQWRTIQRTSKGKCLPENLETSSSVWEVLGQFHQTRWMWKRRWWPCWLFEHSSSGPGIPVPLSRTGKGFPLLAPPSVFLWPTSLVMHCWALGLETCKSLF